MRTFLLSASLWLSVLGAAAQTPYPTADGDRARYTATIEMQRGYLSGVCVLLREGDDVKGCLFNEFGLTALEFTYSTTKNKVKLHSVLPMLDKWYIRRVLRRDLREVMHRLAEGQTAYEDTRYHITYTFTPLTDEAQQ